MPQGEDDQVAYDFYAFSDTMLCFVSPVKLLGSDSLSILSNFVVNIERDVAVGQPAQRRVHNSADYEVNYAIIAGALHGSAILNTHSCKDKCQLATLVAALAPYLAGKRTKEAWQAVGYHRQNSAFEPLLRGSNARTADNTYIYKWLFSTKYHFKWLMTPNCLRILRRDGSRAGQKGDQK